MAGRPQGGGLTCNRARFSSSPRKTKNRRTVIGCVPARQRVEGVESIPRSVFHVAAPAYRYARVRRGEPFDPYSRGSVLVIGQPLRHVVISSFPGGDEKAKLNAVFKSAPPWLIWFTFADYTAAVLGLELPDLSRVTCFARSRDAFDNWWGLPRGSFEKRPWPKSLVKDPLSGTDLNLLRPQPARQAFTTRRERKRAVTTFAQTSSRDEWPMLIPLELLQGESMQLIEQKKHPQFAGAI